MILLVYLLLLVFVSAVAIGAFGYMDAGYVLLSWDTYTLETTLWFFLVVLAIALIAIYMALRSLLLLFGSDKRFNEWRKKRRSMRATRKTTRGLLAMAQGQWSRAERNLTSSATDSDQPLINYLAAARAAFEQGKEEATDEWLKAASQSTKGSELAVGISHVSLLQSRQQHEQALAVLINLREQYPRHPYLLKLLTKTLQELGDWVALNDLLPALRKGTKVSDADLNELEEKVAIQLLERAQHTNGGRDLTKVFASINRDTRNNAAVLHRYVELLVATEQDAVGEEALREGLKSTWSDALIEQFGVVKGSDASKQLLFAEQQLQERPNDPLLLLTLGRLALRVGSTEKAREYLQTGLRIKSLPALHAEMGKVMLAEGDETLACEHFQLALSID
ncbi:MAG: heme biosynthesis HemY N-terminal domain-containing protein [Oleibacter sp.]|nr:heme biosynthesis HemY N-terminal domain-containing protein [Thalassolituus sp.]